MFPTRISVSLIFVLFTGAAAASDGCDSGGSFDGGTSSCDTSSFSTDMSFTAPDLTSILMTTIYDPATVSDVQASVRYRLKLATPLSNGADTVSYQEAYRAVAALFIAGETTELTRDDQIAILNASIQRDLVQSPTFGLPLLKGLGVDPDAVAEGQIDVALTRKFVLNLNLLERARDLAGPRESEVLATKARYALYMIYSHIENSESFDAKKKKMITQFLSRAVATLPPSEVRTTTSEFLRSLTDEKNMEEARARYVHASNRSETVMMGVMSGWLLGPLSLLAHLSPQGSLVVNPLLYVVGPMVAGSALGAAAGYAYYRMTSVPFAGDPTRLAAAIRSCRTALGADRE